MAEKDKQRYIREYMAYQDTDSYKEFMRKKYPGLTKKSKVRAESPPPQQTAKAKVTHTCLRERERGRERTLTDKVDVSDRLEFSFLCGLIKAVLEIK